MSNANIRVGLVGYGTAGAVFHAPLIRASAKLELTGILTSRDVPLRVDDLRSLIEQSDLLVIASPNSTHFEIARQALEAGKHVVIDKPISVTVKEADDLIDLAGTMNRLLSVFHNRRWDSDFLTVRRLLPKLGTIALFDARWDRFRPSIKRGWREVAGQGSGLLNDLGPHLVDQSLQLLGMPDAIEADIIAQREGASVDDYFELTLHYGQARMILGSSTLVAAPRPRIAIHGSEGSFVKYGLDPQEMQLKSGADPNDPNFGIDRTAGTLTHPDGERETIANARGDYLSFYRGMAGAILDGTMVPVMPKDARDGLALIELARRAASEGRRISIPCTA